MQSSGQIASQLVGRALDCHLNVLLIGYAVGDAHHSRVMSAVADNLKGVRVDQIKLSGGSEELLK